MRVRAGRPGGMSRCMRGWRPVGFCLLEGGGTGGFWTGLGWLMSGFLGSSGILLPMVNVSG